MVHRSVKSPSDEAHGTAPDAPSAIRLAAVGMCLVGVCYGGGTRPTTARLAWVLLGVLGVLGAAAGDLEARLGPARAWTTTTVALAGATAVLALAPGTPALTHPAAAVFGGSYIAMSGLLLLGGTRVYSDEPSAGVGIAFLVLALGQAAGSLALGALASGTGLRTAVLVAAGVGLLGALAPPRTS